MGLLEKRDATRNDLKWFGLILAAVFGIIGLLLWRRGHPTAGHVLWIIGATLPAVYYLAPPTQRLMFSVWMGLTFPLGWVISTLVMLLVFYLVLTPMGLIMRLLRRDPMLRAYDHAAASYWEPHDPAGRPSRYFRQF